MRRKLPSNAFELYVALGPTRSYRTIAEQFSCDKKTVLRYARNENWQEKLRHIEAEAWARKEMTLAERMAESNQKTLEICCKLRERCLTVLEKAEFTTSEALRGLQLAIETERVVLGMPTDRVARDSRVAVARVHADAIPSLCTPPRSGVADTTLGEEESALLGSNPMASFIRHAMPSLDADEERSGT